MQKNTFIKIDKKKLICIIFIIASTVLLSLILIKNNDLYSIAMALKSIRVDYILVAIVCLLIFWILEAYMIYVLIVKFTDKKATLSTFWLSLKVTLIGQYYSNITPGASGGQPVQLYVMSDNKIPLSEGIVVLVEKFLLYQIGVTIYSLVLAVMRIKVLMSCSKASSAFIFIGLAINILMVTAIWLISIKPKIITNLIKKIVAFLYKHHIVKKIDNINNSIDKFVVEYETSIEKMKANKLLTAKLFIVTFLQLTAFFSITYFIYRSFNLNEVSVFEIICLQAFVYMSVSFIPIPGTIGVSEMGFLTLLGNVFSKNIIATAMLLWRGVSYYFSLIFSGIFVLFVSIFKKNKIKV